MKDRPQHPMGVVTRKTGLRADVIRAWERRHRAIEPARSAGKRRLYTDADIRRLTLIREAVRGGWQIGQVARLDNAAIRDLVGEPVPVATAGPVAVGNPATIDMHLRQSWSLLTRLDADGLERQLEMASVEMTRVELFDRLIVPLIETIGEGCSDGRLRTTHEHLATAVLRTFLDSQRGAFGATETSPAIIVTTPAHQHHELAAMLVAATARSAGWKTTYLGPNLPGEEIAAAARQKNAGTIALSITFPGDDPHLPEDLKKLRRLVPDAEILVGGRSAGAYDVALRQIEARRLATLAALRSYLVESRSDPGRAAS